MQPHAYYARCAGGGISKSRWPDEGRIRIQERPGAGPFKPQALPDTFSGAGISWIGPRTGYYAAESPCLGRHEDENRGVSRLGSASQGDLWTPAPYRGTLRE